MNRGCLIALIAFAACMLLLLVLVVVVPLYVFDILDSAPRVSVATFVTGDTVAALTIDPNHQKLYDLIDQGGNRLSWFLPHEAGVVVDLDSARKKRTVTLAGSPKHLGPAFMLMFSDKNALGLADLESNGGAKGIDTWTTPALTREKGAIILRGEGAVEPETETLAATYWPEAAPRTPIQLEGGHVIEAVIRNDGGEGILALEPFFRVDMAKLQEDATAANDTAADDTAANGPTHEVETSSAEAPDEEDAAQDTGATEEQPAPESVTSGDESALGLLLCATEIKILGDFTEGGDFKIAIAARTKDEAGAEAASEVIDGLREVARTELKKEDITVTGETAAAGGVVTGEIVYSGYKARFAKWLNELQR